ncbi:peptidoglycan recognition protein 1-like [Euwallacea fornicatus]|uniref:peptidoglycan recognition protein 1-like n=1 Tax=Euwallacea fornicatus TaxID=995702 RepID=UPI00338D740A
MNSLENDMSGSKLSNLSSNFDNLEGTDDYENIEHLDVENFVVDRTELKKINGNLEQAIYKELNRQQNHLSVQKEVLLKQTCGVLKKHVQLQDNQIINIKNSKKVTLGNTVNIVENIILKDENGQVKYDSKKKRNNKNYFYINRRQNWLAKEMPTHEMNLMELPVRYVIICHTATSEFYTHVDNVEVMGLIQDFHVSSMGWLDIAYNYCIGSDGNIYEGRGWDYCGSHTLGYNNCSMGISFIGCFLDHLPPAIALKKCKELIDHGIKIGKIRPDYELIGHCQCRPFLSPGKKLFEEISTWKQFNPDIKNTDLCIYSTS